MLLADKFYDKQWAQKTQSMAPAKLARSRNVNVDLNWPDNGLAKSSVAQDKLTRKIGVSISDAEREVFLDESSQKR